MCIKKLRLIVLVCITILFLISGCSTEIDDKRQSLRFAVTDIEGLEQLQLGFRPFKDILEEKTGMKFEFFAVNSRTAVVEALKASKVDVVMSGPAEYVAIKKRSDARPLVGFSRVHYTSAIITTKETGITTLEDLKGKKVAFGNVGSTGGHLGAMQMFADVGIDPLKYLEIIHTSDVIMHEALKKGDVVAIAQSYDKWTRLYEKEPKEIQDTFYIIQESETLPNDILVVGTHIDDQVFNKLLEAFKTYPEELKVALTSTEGNRKYEGMSFVLDVKDSDYDKVPEMYKTAGYPKYAEFIR